jgi:hypothetical protein
MVMSVQIGWAGIGVILAILIHGAASIWWASKITSQISNLGTSVLRMDKELEKRDTLISAAWKKIDHLGDRVTRVEAKCNVTHGGME